MGSEVKERSSQDFLDIWKRSEPPQDTSKNVQSPISKTKIGERLNGERSLLWTNLSQMSPADQAVMMGKLTNSWPYANERRALNWPMHAGLLTNCVTSAFIATKINSDMILYNSKVPFLEAVQKCPKAPFIFGVYTSGVTYFVLKQVTVMKTVYRESNPCASCLLSQSMAISLFTGIVMPMVATPYLCYYVLMQRKNEKFPPIKNMLDFLMLSIEGSKAARPLLLRLIPLQFIVTAVSTYAMLWGRERVFNTMDADPDLAKELLVTVQSKPSFKERFTNFLRSIPFLSDAMPAEAPEQERV
ncbi:unnamed protein product [Auanema sp. JU1783]|nr:unnamed protein product [Auanema sp. JU1783]